VTPETEFAAALAYQLGPLFRVTVKSEDGSVLESFGRIDESLSAGDDIHLPNSSCLLTVDIDARALVLVDRVIHDLVAAHQLAETPLGALAHLDDALAQLIAQGEASIGRSLKEMTRAEKQQLVRFLDERGAFALRKAVERVAEVLGVSRFTVYNYLDSFRAS
jgi:hypothetical protein